MRASKTFVRFVALCSIGTAVSAAICFLVFHDRELSDAPQSPRVALPRTLQNSEDPKSTPLDQWMREARSTDSNVRHEAVSKIISMGPAAQPATQILIEMLEGNAEDRGMASSALDAIGKTALPAVRKALTHTSPNVRRGAALTLAKMGSDAVSASADLQKLLDDNDPSVRDLACHALGEIGDVTTVDRLLDVAEHDADHVVRGTAAQAAAQISKTDVVATTVLRCWTSGGISALAAGNALRKMGKSAVPALMAFVENRNTQQDSRLEALDILSRVRDIGDENVNRLMLLLADRDEEVRRETIDALEALGQGNQKVIAKLQSMFDDKSALVRISAASGIFRLTKTVHPAIEIIMKELTNTDAGMRERACDQLANWGPAAKQAVPALIQRLRDKKSGVRWQAIRALGEIGPAARDAERELEAIVNGNDAELRKKAERALEKIRGPRKDIPFFWGWRSDEGIRDPGNCPVLFAH